MSLEIGRQRFNLAVRCLVDEQGPIKERLLVAYVSQLSAINTDVDLPGEMGAQFGAIKIRLGEDQVQGDRGNAASQLEKMSDAEACKIADDIFAMFLKLYGVAADGS